jgi:hypothetical protein
MPIYLTSRSSVKEIRKVVRQTREVKNQEIFLLVKHAHIGADSKGITIRSTGK